MVDALHCCGLLLSRYRIGINLLNNLSVLRISLGLNPVFYY